AYLLLKTCPRFVEFCEAFVLEHCDLFVDMLVAIHAGGTHSYQFLHRNFHSNLGVTRTSIGIHYTVCSDTKILRLDNKMLAINIQKFELCFHTVFLYV